MTLTSGPGWGADLNARLAAGEILVSTTELPETGVKQGEATGVVKAPPAKVWQVISDVNRYSEFMPRTVNSRVVTPEQVAQLGQVPPASAAEVEAVLGPIPPDPAPFRQPGGKNVEYLYGRLRLPWPLGERWYILRLERDETQAERQVYTATWRLMMGNLRENRGEWHLKAFGEGHTLLLYRLAADPGCRVPKFLLNQGTLVTLPEVLQAVRRRVAQMYPSVSTP